MSDQLSLPYEEITKVANRAYLREAYTKGPTESYWIPFEELTVREGFNRTVFKDIEEMAQSLEEHGQITPLRVDVLESGEVRIDEGERRYKGMDLVRKKNIEKFAHVLCYVNNSGVTEQQRAERVWISNMSRQNLHPLDQAQVVFRLKTMFGKSPSNEELGKRFGVSRQTIENLLLVHSMPDDLKNQIRQDTITVTDALSIVRDKKKLEKQADKAEQDSHITSTAPTAFPKDDLKDEVAELKALDIQAEQQKERQAEFDEKEKLRLEKDAVEVAVTVEALTPHIGKRLAKNAMYDWVEDFVNKDTGEAVPVKSSIIVLKQGVVINELTIEDLIGAKVDTVWVLKDITVAKSFITEIPATEEKSKFDISRPEIGFIQNIIKLSDKLEMMVSKLDVPEGIKTDVSSIVKWIQNDAAPLRDWIHANKKENKKGF